MFDASKHQDDDVKNRSHAIIPTKYWLKSFSYILTDSSRILRRICITREWFNLARVICIMVRLCGLIFFCFLFHFCEFIDDFVSYFYLRRDCFHSSSVSSTLCHVRWATNDKCVLSHAHPRSEAGLESRKAINQAMQTLEGFNNHHNSVYTKR